MVWESNYTESWVLKNWCFWTVVLEKTLESPLDCKEIQPVHPKGNQSWNIHWKGWYWSWNSNTLATWCEELTRLKRSWCRERLKAGGEGDNRGWDGWMASPTQWTWVWVNSRSWWWTGRPGVLQSMGSQRVRYDWLNRTIGIIYSSQKVYLSPHSSQQNLAPNFLWLFPKPKSTFRGWEFAIVEFQPLQDTDRDSLSVEGDPSGWLLDIWDSLNFHLISP